MSEYVKPQIYGVTAPGGGYLVLSVGGERARFDSEDHLSAFLRQVDMTAAAIWPPNPEAHRQALQWLARQQALRNEPSVFSD